MGAAHLIFIPSAAVFDAEGSRRYDYLPLVDRPLIRWPNDARVAFWVGPNIEFYEMIARRAGSSGVGPPHPDVLNYSLRDYGNRAGVWRVMEALERFGVRASVSLNAAICEHMPDIVDECLRLKWELFSHGIYNTRLITGLNEDEVRHVIRERRELNERVDLICRDLVGAHRRLVHRMLDREKGQTGDPKHA
jgi:hypothetical protein